MSKRKILIEQVKNHGIKFPSRHRFVLTKQDGKLAIITTQNKNKIKLENEKFSNNRSILLDGSPTALLDIQDVNSPEEYADTLIKHLKKWELLEEDTSFEKGQSI